jgi:hypothetical protein
MSSKSAQSRAARQRPRHGQSSRAARVARWLGGNAAFGLLAITVVFLIAAMGLAARNAPAHAVGQPSAATGQQTQPQWIALKSEAPGDIVAAVRQSRLFTVNRAGNGDHLTDVSHVGTPQFVRELRRSATSPGVDCYVVPILDGSGTTGGAAVAWLNPAHTAIYVGYIRAYDVPLASWTGTLPGADGAVGIVRAQHHAGLRKGAQPQLIYFPFDFQGRWSGRVTWSAGGEGPDTPVWLVAGDDGQDHVVGRDGHAYLVSELPLSPLAH